MTVFSIISIPPAFDFLGKEPIYCPVILFQELPIAAASFDSHVFMLFLSLDRKLISFFRS